MTHSGGKPHNVGDKGQRYEISVAHKYEGNRHVVGWSETLEGARKMANGAQMHPSWSHVRIFDRHANHDVPVQETEVLDIPKFLRKGDD